MKKHLIYIILIIVVFSACCAFRSQSQDDMFIVAASLKKLSASVEASARYKDVPEYLRDNELLVQSTENNPQLLEGFEDYSLKAIITEKHSIVLLCDAESNEALIEDTGCTGEVDVHHWQQEQVQPCNFTLDVNIVCNK